MAPVQFTGEFLSYTIGFRKSKTAFSTLFLSCSRLLIPQHFHFGAEVLSFAGTKVKHSILFLFQIDVLLLSFYDVTAPKDFYKWLAWSRTMQLKDKTFISDFAMLFSHLQNQRSGNFFLADLRIENVLQPKPSKTIKIDSVKWFIAELLARACERSILNNLGNLFFFDSVRTPVQTLREGEGSLWKPGSIYLFSNYWMALSMMWRITQIEDNIRRIISSEISTSFISRIQ